MGIQRGCGGSARIQRQRRLQSVLREVQEGAVKQHDRKIESKKCQRIEKGRRKSKKMGRGLANSTHNFMYNQNKESSPRLRINRSQEMAVKKSNSGHLGPNKSIITRLLFDKPNKSPRGRSFLESPKQQVAVMRITNRRSSSFQRKSKIVLKPITERKEQLALPELLAVKQHPKSQLVEQDIEEMFYRQVRILQQFKKMAELVQ